MSSHPKNITNIIIIGVQVMDFRFFLKKNSFFLSYLDFIYFFIDDILTMRSETINRAYLETLSFADLSKLADDYGIEVPEDLDRRFLIAELLELSEEVIVEEDMTISSELSAEETVTLPKNYNETQIDVVLRNPAWLFVFWNISDADFIMLKNLGSYALKLRVCYLESPKDTVPVEAFEVNTVNGSQEQYIFIKPEKKYIKVELVYVTASSGKVLAFSPVISIPQGSSLVNDWQPGCEQKFSQLLELSGINEVLTEQYTNYRHSFS